jgi:hypothetical protein
LWDRWVKALGLEKMNASTKVANLSTGCEQARQAAEFHFRRDINQFGWAR